MLNGMRTWITVASLMVMWLNAGTAHVHAQVPDSPTQQEVEDLLRTMGRGAIVSELVDGVMLQFRNNWARSFARTRELATDPDFVRRIDAAYHEVLGRPATNIDVIRQAWGYHVGYDDACIQKRVRDSVAEKEGVKSTVSIRGVVVDEESDQPISGALVYEVCRHTATRTNPNGTYELNGLSGRYSNFRLFAEREGYAMSETIVSRDPKAALTIEHRIKMVKEVLFNGRVLDSEGAPVAASTLFAQVNRSDICRDGSTEQSLWGGNAATLTTMSDTDGWFSFRGMPPAAKVFGVEAKHPRFQAQEVANLTAPTDPATPLTITLKPGCEVSGRVIDEAGQPVPGAWIQVREPGGAGYEFQTHTDKNGQFVFYCLQPASRDIVVEPEAHAMAVAAVTIQEDRPIQELKIVVRRGDFISGVVLDPEGKPVAGAHVMGLKPSGSGCRLNRVTSTNALGAFRIGPVSSGEFEMTAVIDPPRFIGKATGQAGDKKVVIRLERGTP